MAQTPRRSTRLEAKLSSHKERINSLRKRRINSDWSDEDSGSHSDHLSEKEDEDEKIGSSDYDNSGRSHVLPVKRMRDKNNFTTVYSSYNMDKEGDYYEDDFIDDSQYVTNSSRKSQRGRIGQRVRNRVGVVNESDSDGSDNHKGQGSSSKRGVSKRHLFSSDSEDEEIGEITKKRKRARWKTSDDEIDHTPSRRSDRAEKLKNAKIQERNNKLRQLKLQRAAKKGDVIIDQECVPNEGCVILSENEESGSDSGDSGDSGDDECDWIIADNDVDNVDLLKEYNIIDSIDPNGIASTMNMNTTMTKLLQIIQSNPGHVTNQLIMAAGRADYKKFEQLSNQTNLKRAMSILSDNNVSLIHVIISTPWKQFESQNENQSLEDDHVTTSDDTNCRECLSILANRASSTFRQLVTKSGFHIKPSILELSVWKRYTKTTEFLLSYCNKIDWNWREPRVPFCDTPPDNWPPTLLHVVLYRCMLEEGVSKDNKTEEGVSMDNNEEGVSMDNSKEGVSMDNSEEGVSMDNSEEGVSMDNNEEAIVIDNSDEGVSAYAVNITASLFESLDKKDLCERDNNGNIPLMYAAQMDYCEILEILAKHKPSLKMTDTEGHTPLHLAAASGCLECVKQLLINGHEVDCRDYKGWPPLLYAHFSGNTDCYLELMGAKPTQLSVLSDLLRNIDNDENENRRKTTKVVRDLLVSLAHTELYYNQFNDFIGNNLQLLDDRSFGFMKHCMSLLCFNNKQRWLEMKLESLRENTLWSYSSVSGLSLKELPRQHLLQRVLQLLWNVSAAEIWKYPLSVGFANEAGACTGPRREFWSILSREFSNGAERVFQQCDDSQLSLQPCKIMSDHTHPRRPTPFEVSTHHHKLHVVGSLLATVIFHHDTMDCNLTNVLTKQLLGRSVSPLEDLKEVDRHLYNQLTDLINEDGSENLDLTFSTTLLSPWCERGVACVNIPLNEGGAEYLVTDTNKNEFVSSLAKFKMVTSTSAEVTALQKGFWKVIPKKYLTLFTPNEFSLLLSGVSHINVDEWRDNTRYVRLSDISNIVSWFWRLVNDLSQQEKGLLLKFATGSPRLPPGGFKNLMGLGGPTLFTLSLGEGHNKIPKAQTCFNLLLLSNYNSEQELRNKVLIAIRYGCEGFEFS